MKPLFNTIKQGTMNGNGRPSPAATYGVFGLLAIIILGFFGLAFFGRELGTIVTIMGPIVVVLIGLVPVIAGQSKTNDRMDEHSEKLDKIEHQTNGVLDAKFRKINERLDAMIGEPQKVNVDIPADDTENLGDA